MGNTYTNVAVHIIFHTKNGCPKIEEPDLPELFRYIGGVIKTMSGVAYIVGGRPDHVHVLTLLPSSISLADFVRTIKANSSRRIKEINPYYEKFAWQRGFGAFAVSQSNKGAVIEYITNQKEHHRYRSAHEEFQQFLEKNGLLMQGEPQANNAEN